MKNTVSRCYLLYDREDTKKLAYCIAQLAESGFFVFLEGEIGTGKTTLVKFIGSYLGISESQIYSPTFTISYRIFCKRKSFFFSHLDCYRLSREEKDVFWYDDLTESFSVIEWASKLRQSFSPLDSWVKITLFFGEKSWPECRRIVKLEGKGFFWIKLKKQVSLFLKKI